MPFLPVTGAHEIERMREAAAGLAARALALAEARSVGDLTALLTSAGER